MKQVKKVLALLACVTMISAGLATAGFAAGKKGQGHTKSTPTWSLYKQYCAGCHGTSKEGVSASTIQNAIKTVSAMNSLSSLTSAQISALAAGQ